MKKNNFFSVIIAVLTLVAVISLIIIIIFPAPIKPIIRRWIKSSNYPLSNSAKIYDNYVLYENKSVINDDDDDDDDDADDNDKTRYILAIKKNQEQLQSQQQLNESNLLSSSPSSSSSSSSPSSSSSSSSSNESHNNEQLVEKLQTLNTSNAHKKILSKNQANVILNESKPVANTKSLNNNIIQSVDARRNLIVFFIGGSFLFQELKSHYGIGNKLYELMGPNNFDVMLVRYPVRFGSTLQQSMLSINKSLSDVMLKYKEFYAIGYSAGALLASIFIQKELNMDYSKKIKIPQIGVSFRKFIGICGLYYPVFINNTILTKLFKYYILRNTTSSNLYTVTSSMESIPKLVITNTTDFLYDQTAKFIQTIPNTAYKIYTNTKLSHTFIENIDSVETQDALELIRKFILQPTN